MYDYALIERELGRRTYFPNSNEVAYFDPHSQTIHLNQITAQGFHAALAANDKPALRQQFGTMLHEITHWADLVGTLWGREYLRAVYATLRLLPTISLSGAEFEFHRFIDLHDRTRRLLLARYFRTVNSHAGHHDHRRPWRITLSAGREFDNFGRLNDSRPIVFARFGDNSTDEHVARQPIVAGSLLEVNAVWSELRTNAAILRDMSDFDRIIEEKKFSKERLEQLYHIDLTLYTAPTHLLSMTLRTTDISIAYEYSSAVAHLVLNLQDTHFVRLEPPEVMRPWQNLFQGFKASREVGFAYAAICQAASPWVEGRPTGEWLDEALARVGLDTAASIYESAKRRMKEDVVAKGDDLLGRAERYLLSLGADVLAIQIAGDTALTPGRVAIERVTVPPMFGPDGQLIDLSSGAFDRTLFPPEELHQQAASLHTWTQNFLNACR